MVARNEIFVMIEESYLREHFCISIKSFSSWQKLHLISQELHLILMIWQKEKLYEPADKIHNLGRGLSADNHGLRIERDFG
jgi:hypothetical protein